jgi:hypothetical protein
MVWPSSAQGIRPYEREDCPNHIGVSLCRLSPPPLFSSPYRSSVPSGVEGPLVYPVYPELRGERSRVVTPSNSFRSNTYRIVWKCSFQKTYRNSKSFRSNTYKKTGGWGSALPVFVSPLITRHSLTALCLGASVAILMRRCRPVGVPLFSNGKRPLSLFSSCRYRSFFFTTRGGTPPPPYGKGPSMCFAPLRCPQEREIRPSEGGLLSSPHTSHQPPVTGLRPLWS